MLHEAANMFRGSSLEGKGPPEYAGLTVSSVGEATLEAINYTMLEVDNLQPQYLKCSSIKLLLGST